MDEQILVVDRNWLFEDEETAFQGIVTRKRAINSYMIKMRAYFEARRGDAEENPEWKQPIPYVVIQRGDEVFLYERLKAGNEKRLHNRLSIGVGGHMNNLQPTEGFRMNLLTNLDKEVAEELHIDLDETVPPKIIGLINDDLDDVGRVHFGIVAIIQVPKGNEVTVRETDKLDGYWVRIKDLQKTPLYDNLESWSKMVADIL